MSFSLCSLYRGEQLLGKIRNAEVEEMFWFAGIFEPVPAFAEVKELFAQARAPENRDKLDDLWNQVVAKGPLRVESDDKQCVWNNVMIHIFNDGYCRWREGFLPKRMRLGSQ